MSAEANADMPHLPACIDRKRIWAAREIKMRPWLLSNFYRKQELQAKSKVTVQDTEAPRVESRPQTFKRSGRQTNATNCIEEGGACW
eukprot:12405027-Karenia_brevis.AAC.1